MHPFVVGNRSIDHLWSFYTKKWCGARQYLFTAMLHNRDHEFLLLRLRRFSRGLCKGSKTGVGVHLIHSDLSYVDMSHPLTSYPNI